MVKNAGFGSGSRSHDTVTAIYRIARQGEAERFLDLGNRRLMWHGSRRSNFISTLETRALLRFRLVLV